MFQMLFERSADAIFLFDPESGRFVDCNAAAVALLRASSKNQLLNASPAELAPPSQTDGSPSDAAAAKIAATVQQRGSYRFEWLARRFDGTDVPLEVLATVVPVGDRTLHVVTPRDISHRKEVEAEIRHLNQTLEHRIAEATAGLRAGEAQFRMLVEHAPEAIVVFEGETGRFLMVNDHAVRLFGRSREELLRLTPAEVSPKMQPDGRLSSESAREKMQAAVAGEMPVFEWVHEHASGRGITCEIRLLKLPGTGPSRVRASIIDLTQRKRREKLLRAAYDISEAVHAVEDLPSLYERIHRIIGGLMPASNFYIALYDAPHATISFPYFVDESSPAPEPFQLGTGLTSYIVRTGNPLLVGPKLNALKRRNGNEVEFEGVPGLRYVESGKPAAIWLGVPLSLRGVSIGAMAVQDYHDPNAYGEQEKQMLVFVAEQTALALERKRAQQALRESEEKFRALFEATSTGVMLHDEHQYLEVNDAVVRMFGYQSPADFVGRNPVSTSPPFQPGGVPTAELARRHLEDCLANGSTRFDWVALKADGTEFPVEVVLTRIPFGGRQVMQAVLTDITERKRAEAEMWRALERERELSLLKSNFVSMVSHEFRTPLGIIQSSAEILADYSERLDPRERQDHLTSISRNTRRMAGLMEEVLILGRLDAGKMCYQPALLDLRVFLQRLTEDVLFSTDRACPIQLCVSEGIPDLVQADERLLRHTFTNLLSNAVKYSEPGQRVEFSVFTAGAEAVFRVRDQGIGIPAADLPRLFQAFHRGKNVQQRPGSGLGLVIAKRCVDLHGGTLRLQSIMGEGTSVTVRLPLLAAVEKRDLVS